MKVSLDTQGEQGPGCARILLEDRHQFRFSRRLGPGPQRTLRRGSLGGLPLRCRRSRLRGQRGRRAPLGPTLPHKITRRPAATPSWGLRL